MSEATQNNRASLIQRIRVPLGFLFGIAFLFLAAPDFRAFLPGVVLAGLGVSLRLWAAGHLRKHQSLSVSGPYRWTRNPLYFGSFLMGLGFTLAASIWWLILLFVAFFLLVYLPVMRKEESELLAAYGEPYRHYLQFVSLFFPGRPYPGSGNATGNFCWNQVIRNKEYNAVIGFVLLTAFLAYRLTAS